MKTDDLIAAIAADATTPPRRVGPAVAFALVVAGLASGLVFATLFHVRPDAAAALATLRFPLKLGLVAAFALAGGALALDLARPGAAARRGRLALAGSAVLLLAAVAAELLVTPEARWKALLFGRNWLLCLASIPLLSAAPLAVLLVALRRGAPGEPAALGAAAGLLAGTVGALFYGAHCVDDSPLFVAAWYSLSIGAVAVVGALAGSRMLRW